MNLATMYVARFLSSGDQSMSALKVSLERSTTVKKSLSGSSAVTVLSNLKVTRQLSISTTDLEDCQISNSETFVSLLRWKCC